MHFQSVSSGVHCTKSYVVQCVQHTPHIIPPKARYLQNRQSVTVTYNNPLRWPSHSDTTRTKFHTKWTQEKTSQKLFSSLANGPKGSHAEILYSTTPLTRVMLTSYKLETLIVSILMVDFLSNRTTSQIVLDGVVCELFLLQFVALFLW